MGENEELDEKAIQEALEAIGKGSAGYNWNDYNGDNVCDVCQKNFSSGYRCGGGSHYVCFHCVNRREYKISPFPLCRRAFLRFFLAPVQMYHGFYFSCRAHTIFTHVQTQTNTGTEADRVFSQGPARA